MAVRSVGAQWRAFIVRLQQIGGQRSRVVIVDGGPERAVVQIDDNAYLVFVPESELELTPGRILSRARSWPKLKGHEPRGYIILSPSARVSRSLRSSGFFEAPLRAAAVGNWGRENEVAFSSIDDEMALILEAAGVPEQTVVRLLGRSMSGTSAPVPAGSRNDDLPPTSVRNLRAGHVIDAYRLEERLGKGFSAVVWRASVVGDIPGVPLSRGDSVAIKLYLPALLQGFETLRIQREFAVAADLRHPNLARVYDLVLSPSRPLHAFMVMELVQGGTLRSAIETRGRLSDVAVFRLAEQLFSALDEIHSQDALHRDVKAANIMVPRLSSRDIEIKLVDLGIVSVPSEEKLTQASAFLGSKHSAPMEQLTGEALDERTDIYGAGSVLFHAFSGRPMYANAGPEGAIVVRMLSSPETLPAERDDAIAVAALKALVNRCIAVKSSDRPSSAKECLEELRRIRSRTT